MSEKFIPKTKFSLVIVSPDGKLTTYTAYTIPEAWRVIENQPTPVFSFSVYACALTEEETNMQAEEVLDNEG